METNRSANFFGRQSRAVRLSAHTLALVALVALACGEALAQEQAQQQREDGPPPMRYLPEDVRSRLEAVLDPKARARLCMEIAEERLARAAQYTREDRFEAATGEIGVYEAVVENTIRFLHAPGGKRVSNKARDIFKRVEIGLRSHVTRLESIRRELPERHAVYLKDSIEFVRDQRDLALGAFYDDSVIREPRRPDVTTAAGERATTTVPAQAEAEKKPDQQR